MCQALFPFVPNPAILICDPFNTLALAPHLNIPTLILHGNRDEIVPFSQGQTLAKAFALNHQQGETQQQRNGTSSSATQDQKRPQSKSNIRFIPLQGCGHNDTFAGPHFNTILREFKSFLSQQS